MPNAASDGLTSPHPVAVARFRAAILAHQPPGEQTRMGVAVSGGPDSLALLLIAHAAFPQGVEAATVDHGLRAESAAEAAMVGHVCAGLGVPHETRRGIWESAAREGVQAAARAYRYRELAAWCTARRLPMLATAHHADDQAETLLMRIARGAGVGGLGSIRPVRRLHDSVGSAWPVALIRPMLGFTKRELRAIVAAAGIVPVEDASNDDLRFDRTRARRLLADTLWLDAARLSATASHMADADRALWWAANEEYDRRVVRAANAVDEEEWRLDPRDLPDELLRRIARLVIHQVEDHAVAGYDGPGPNGPGLTRLIARLRAGDSATLGHVLARPGPLWRFTAAPPRKT